MQSHNRHHANFSACHDVLWINDCIEYVMLISMIIASVLVYKGIYQLDVNPRPISFLDNLLLLICFPSFLLFCILNVISGIYVGELNSSVFTNILIVSILGQFLTLKNGVIMTVKYFWVPIFLYHPLTPTPTN